MPLHDRYAPNGAEDGPSRPSVAPEALGRVLELVGRMPALANRAAVYALWSISLQQSDKSAASEIREQFREALDQFATLLGALKEGSEALNISTATAALLDESIWRHGSVLTTADQFVAQAYFLHTMLAGPAMAELSEAHALGALATGPLGGSLAEASKKVRAMLEHASGEDRKKVALSRELTEQTLVKLDDLTLRIQLISVNATVEAARAGGAGAGFGVIAQEINALSSGAKKAVNEIRQGFATI
ncbi:MAG: methyl-accepting chemotaxis protein [Neomegalonema sp.]|nr:methyl-accepting chemotaxis protein [Neomegalonema sp.]